MSEDDSPGSLSQNQSVKIPSIPRYKRWKFNYNENCSMVRLLIEFNKKITKSNPTSRKLTQSPLVTFVKEAIINERRHEIYLDFKEQINKKIFQDLEFVVPGSLEQWKRHRLD